MPCAPTVGPVVAEARPYNAQPPVAVSSAEIPAPFGLFEIPFNPANAPVVEVAVPTIASLAGAAAEIAAPGMVPLTVPEIKRITAALTTRPQPEPLVIHWDAWTRRHQARARWFHQRARLNRSSP